MYQNLTYCFLCISNQDFVVGLSILIRGTYEEKLRWTFSLYDQDRDGFISREEMEDVVGSIFDLMGRTGDPQSEEIIIAERVDQIFLVSYNGGNFRGFVQEAPI